MPIHKQDGTKVIPTAIGALILSGSALRCDEEVADQVIAFLKRGQFGAAGAVPAGDG